MFKSLKAYERYRRFISLISPNRCPFCGEVIAAEDMWCYDCYRYLPFAYGIPEAPENISRLYVCCFYRHRARDAVLRLKYGGYMYPADAFARMLSTELAGADPADMLVPVPSSFFSVIKRGFSSAAVISERLSLYLELPSVNAVKAFPDKAEQKKLSVSERRRNAEKSFYLSDKADIKGKRIILVDDVTTTGSTLSAAAKLLLDGGAADVRAAVFAKAKRISGAAVSKRRYKMRKG